MPLVLKAGLGSNALLVTLLPFSLLFFNNDRYCFLSVTITVMNLPLLLSLL